MMVSTVLVVPQRDGQPNGNGSGWVYDAKRGLIVTNARVVNDGETFKVSVGDKLVPARVIGVDARIDNVANGLYRSRRSNDAVDCRAGPSPVSESSRPGSPRATQANARTRRVRGTRYRNGKLFDGGQNLIGHLL